MDQQEPILLPQEPAPKKRIPLFPIFLALVALIALVRFAFRSPWEGYRTVAYEKMEYQRPDMDALYAAADRLSEEAKKGEDYSAVTKAYQKLNLRYADYFSQRTLCYVRYTLDTKDPFYLAEQQFFDENAALLEQRMDTLYYALAGTPFEDRLESDYFGDGFFDGYRGESHYNEAFVALLQKEDSLIREYSNLMANPTVSYGGIEWSYSELLAVVSNSELSQVVTSFYEKYNPLVGEIYCQLVMVRHDIAQALGYESYADYCYANNARSFTTEEAKAYCQSVREELYPLLLALDEGGILDEYSGHYALEEEALWTHFSAAVNQLGPEMKEVYDFMSTFSLCLLTDGENRAPGSFTTYLYNYDAPLIVGEKNHTSIDLFTVAHEFGHFVDFYANHGAGKGVDVSECLSQGMELLVFSHLDSSMHKEDADYLETSRLLSMLEAIVEQAAYHEFELAVYSLPEEELTPQRLNELSAQYLPTFLAASVGNSDLAPLCWIYVNHYFSSPFYTISYSLSADVALQVYELDQTGDAITPYLALVTGTEGDNISKAATDAGFADPLSQERVAAIRTLFEKRFPT